jgi:hypothetical protein
VLDYAHDHNFIVILIPFHLFRAALGLDLDVMVLDFEDGVALNQKPKARQLVAETLRKAEFGRTERTVRINSIKSGEDLYVCPSLCPGKCDSPYSDPFELRLVAFCKRIG